MGTGELHSHSRSFPWGQQQHGWFGMRVRDDYCCFKADIKSEIVQGLLPTQTKTFAIGAGPFRGASEMKVSKIIQVSMEQLELLWVLFLVFGGSAIKIQSVY